MEKKQNVPALRFQGFSGEWESHYLGMLGVTFSGLSGKTKADFGHGQARFVPYLNVFNHPIADLQETEAIEIDDKQNEVKYGDIFFTTSSETPEEVGMSSVWLGNEKNVYLNSFCFGYRPTSTLYPFFMAFLLRSSSVRKEFVFLAQGISRYNISKNKAMGIGISFPLFREQCKIGDFFQNLDKFIDGKSHKIQKLQQFRQAMLTKLFPREGAAEPELRFRGFSGKWKSQKMKDLGSFLKGKLYSKKNIQTSGVPLILYGRLYTQYELVIDEVDTFAVPYENSVWSIGGEVIVPASGETAEDIAIASVVKQKGILLGGDLNIIRPNDTVSSVFLALSISYGHIHNELAKRAQGKSIVHIHNSDLVQLDIRLPSIEEQKAIGDFFYQLDRYISLQQKKLERMQRLKAALLEKLFV